MIKATWGDDDGNGVLPWVEDRLTQLKAKTPVLFDETDGIDFEAVADTRPDDISRPTPACRRATTRRSARSRDRGLPETAWGTTLDEMITMDSEAIGLGAGGSSSSRASTARSPTTWRSTRS